MAWVETRVRKTGTFYRVRWREAAEPQQETFRDAKQADDFCKLVEGSHNRWPRGWIKGVGFAEDDPTVMTFRQWAETAIRRRGRASERTKGDYRRDLRLHVDPHLGHLAISRFGTDDIADDIADWIKAMRAAGLSDKTIKNVHGMTSSILNDAVHASSVPLDHNPMRGTLPDSPDVRTEEMVFLEPGEVTLIRGHVPERQRDLVTVLFATGLRWSEATALQVHDVALLSKRKTLHVRRAWKRDDAGFFYLGEPKTKRARRTLSLSAELVDLLIPLVSARDPAAFLFTTREDRPLRHSNFYNRMWLPSVARARVCDRHYAEQLAQYRIGRRGTAILRGPAPCDPTVCPGVLTKQPRVHDLRHSHASWMIHEGIRPMALQRRLGHSSIQITYDRYGHLFPDEDDEINAAVDRALART